MEPKEIQFKVSGPPVFADEVFTSAEIRVAKTKRVAGSIKMQFVDLRTAQVVADVVIDTVTCEGLANVLKMKLDEIDKISKSSDPEKELKRIYKPQPAKVTEETEYTG